jgi:hypothetical protein
VGVKHCFLFTALLVYFVGLCACSSNFKNQVEAPQTPELKKYYSLALQGDVKTALNPVQNKKDLTLAEMDLMVKYQDRFVKKIQPQLEVDDQFVTQVIVAYQNYWSEVLTKELTEREGFYLLFKSLNTILKPLKKNILVYDDQRLNELTESVKVEVEKRGYYGLYGMTRPHLELMIWKKQKNKTYKVKLHDGVQKVKVILMDEFKSLGWASYATFGKSFTGGWATKEELYCVKPAYKLKSESYKVSYLKHEARHFADYKLFPKLKQPELEYRAKLTELIYADKTIYELIEKFKTQGENSRVSPHAWANHHVYKNLRAELQKKNEFESVMETPKEAIKTTALNLLKDSSLKFRNQK